MASDGERDDAEGGEVEEHVLDIAIREAMKQTATDFMAMDEVDTCSEHSAAINRMVDRMLDAAKTTLAR